MKYILLFLTLCITYACSTTPTPQKVDFKPQWDTIRVLKNPHKGWYHHLLDNGIDKYAISNDSFFSTFPGMDHLYVRLAWSYLEPSEGSFDWHRIDEVVEKYVPLGYHIAFRISSKETDTYPGSVGQQFNGIQYATPAWVQKAGAKGTVVENGGVRSWTPDWDNAVYLEKLDNFHRAFATRYDNQPWMSYVDIGSIGEWGEGHTHFSTKVPPTVEQVKVNIDIFLKNYPKSQLVVTDDLLYWGKPEADVKILLDYAVSNGISLRDDSPLVDWYMDKNMNTWSVSHPRFFDPLYLTRPIVFELQHYGNVIKDGNWLGKNGAGKIEKHGYSGAHVMRKAIETMHATYIGYHGYAEQWLTDNPELTRELANLCGYWYFPVSASVPAKMNRDKNEISITWFNKGVAPAYHDYELVLKFESENPDNSFTLQPIASGNKNWLPGIPLTESYPFELLAGAKRGSYTLKFKLEEKLTETNQPIQVGIHESMIDEDGFVRLGKVKI